MTAAGMASNDESKRSSMPPWPGSMLPLSLMPKVRLKRLSTRSPQVPNTVTTSPRPIHSYMLSPTSLYPYCSERYHTQAAAATTNSPPPIEPSQLLPGLMRGKSLCLPSNDPQQYAPLSFTHRNTNTERGTINE